jgi:Fic family protein
MSAASSDESNETDLEGLLAAAQANLISPHETYRLFRALRPFTDGNGRAGRALWMWQSIRASSADCDDRTALSTFAQEAMHDVRVSGPYLN